MDQTRQPIAAAVVGLGAILPDAPDVATFWNNIKTGKYSITDVRADRWDPALYYDPDPKAPDKTYSKIGGWVRDWTWDPLGWHLPIPPRVGDCLEDAQKWAVACSRAALEDYGYPSRELDPERTAVILGSAIGGERQYFTSLRIFFPEFAAELEAAPGFRALSEDVREAIVSEMHAGVRRRFPATNEDGLPGELGNILAGRVANLFNFRGPTFTVDAACASSLAAINAALAALAGGDVDAVVTGGVDRNMGVNFFVKFAKIGALSATGTRPYAEGADGFVMGEGASVFLLKRLADAERDGDRIYAVIRGAGGASDGRGKGITAPNPAGQRLAIERAWRQAGVSPDTVSLLEGHGTSTRVGDVVEVDSLHAIFGGYGLATGSVALGSVKSNIGHLKAGAGAAGMLKTVLALHEKVLPPSLHFARANPDIDFAHSPFYVNTELREWEVPPGGVRRAGLSAFGFGGTNFHAVVDEYIPGSGNGSRLKVVAVPATPELHEGHPTTAPKTAKAPLRGALVVGAAEVSGLMLRLRTVHAEALAGGVPAVAAPAQSDLSAPVRVAIDYATAPDLAEKTSAALHALESGNAAEWRMLHAQGVFCGRGPRPRVAFLYTGQGSQYVNMLHELRQLEPVVAETFAEADRVMTPLLGRPLSEFIFVGEMAPDDETAARERLGQTAVTQPAVLAVDAALTRLLAAYGVHPDMVMGHSMGEYAALEAAGSLSFEDALRAVTARGRAVSDLQVDDPGRMVAVFAPLEDIARILDGIDGHVVIVNINSNTQAVIAGATDAVDRSVDALHTAGHTTVALPISHAFHTAIVAAAAGPLRLALGQLDLRPPAMPVVANLTGDFYPMGEGAVPEMVDILARHVSSPVQFVKGLHTLYDAGVRVFVEVGPKRALDGFVADVLGEHPDVLALFTNHPKFGDVISFNRALCGLYASGWGDTDASSSGEQATAMGF
jgi:acyl transferase domain-containing protein